MMATMFILGAALMAGGAIINPREKGVKTESKARVYGHYCDRKMCPDNDYYDGTCNLSRDESCPFAK